MRVCLPAISMFLCQLLYVFFFGLAKCPLDVFLNLLCFLLVAFLSTIVSIALFDRRGLEALSESPDALFYYSFGTAILTMIMPSVSIYFSEFRYTTIFGHAVILLATLIFNHMVETEMKRSKR